MYAMYTLYFTFCKSFIFFGPSVFGNPPCDIFVHTAQSFSRRPYFRLSTLVSISNEDNSSTIPIVGEIISPTNLYRRLGALTQIFLLKVFRKPQIYTSNPSGHPSPINFSGYQSFIVQPHSNESVTCFLFAKNVFSIWNKIRLHFPVV